jgi:hypothetical protein
MCQIICISSKSYDTWMLLQKENILHNFFMHMFNNIWEVSINVEHVDGNLVQSYQPYICLPNDKYVSDS